MHEKSTFSLQLAEYKAMPKLTKLMHRTLFWVYMSDYNQKVMYDAYYTIKTTNIPFCKVVSETILQVASGKNQFCTDRLKQAQRDLMNLLIGIEQINNIVS